MAIAVGDRVLVHIPVGPQTIRRQCSASRTPDIPWNPEPDTRRQLRKPCQIHTVVRAYSCGCCCLENVDVVVDQAFLVRLGTPEYERIVIRHSRALLLRAYRHARADNPELWDLTEIFADKDAFLSESIDDPSQVAWSRIPEDKYSLARRVRTYLMRYIRRTGKYKKISDDKLQRMCAQIRAHSAAKPGVTVVRGAKLAAAYRDHHGSSSCMTGEDCEAYIRMYVENPDRVGLAISNNPAARALVWKTDSGVVVLDRIYPNEPDARECMHAWAREQGYTLRTHNSAPDPSDEELDRALHVSVVNKTDTWPYLDTFRYIERHGRPSRYEYILHAQKRSTCKYVALETDGTTRRLCPFCSDGILSGDNTCTSCSAGECEACGTLAEQLYDGYCDDCTDKCCECGDRILPDMSCRADDDNENLYCETCFNALETCDECKCALSSPLHADDNATHAYCASCLDELETCMQCNDSLRKPLFYNDKPYCKACMAVLKREEAACTE